MIASRYSREARRGLLRGCAAAWASRLASRQVAGPGCAPCKKASTPLARKGTTATGPSATTAAAMLLSAASVSLAAQLTVGRMSEGRRPARRQAVPGVRLCVPCQAEADRQVQAASPYNRRGSKDSQLR